jgi:hypothetical protein
MNDDFYEPEEVCGLVDKRFNRDLHDWGHHHRIINDDERSNETGVLTDDDLDCLNNVANGYKHVPHERFSYILGQMGIRVRLESPCHKILVAQLILSNYVKQQTLAMQDLMSRDEDTTAYL